MDVKGLYPSVPKKEGLDACKQALDNRPNPSTENKCEVCQKIAQVTVVPIHLSMY
jgi:hypothetical protein